MSKVTAIIIALLIVMASIVGFKMMKDSERNLLANKKQPTDLTSFDFQNWHEFAEPNGKFKVLVPALPQHATENINDSKTQEKKRYDTFISTKDDGTIFMISMITFDSTDIGSQAEGTQILKEIMNDMVASSPNNKLISSQTEDYKGHPSLNFTLENGDMQIDAKTFVFADTLYVLTRIEKPKSESRDEFLFFINSFELTPTEKTNTTLPKKGK